MNQIGVWKEIIKFQKILKKGKNTLAIRVTDLGGPGGFNSPVLLKVFFHDKRIAI